jgi:GNAT superfamily N-acetyltransferase
VVDIIKAGTQHIPFIQEVAQKTWPTTFGHILSKAQISYMLEMMYSTPSLEKQMRHKNHLFILAMNSARTLGFASFETNHQHSDKTKIHKIYILPEAQGRGVGKALIQ